MILSTESKSNTTDPPVAVTDSSMIDYDLADESSVCSTPLPPLEKLPSAEPVSGPKTIKSILKSNSTFKAEVLKGVITNEPFSAPAKGNKSTSASTTYSAPAGLMHDHMDSLHAPGDQIGVTSYTGHAAKKSTIDYTSFGEFGTINLSIVLSTGIRSFFTAIDDTNAINKDGIVSSILADEGKGSVTSTGELNSFSIMNPSNAYGLDVEEGIWSAKVIGEINTSIAIPFGAFPSLNKVTSIRSKPTKFRSGNPTMSTRPTVSFNATSTSAATRENIHSKPNTYAGVAGSSDHSKDVNNFQHLVVEKLYEGINISIPQKVIEKVSVQFENTLYGYFIGKRLAFLVVKWTMRTSLLNEELTQVLVYVKFHDVSLQVFEKDGISLIGTYIGALVANKGTLNDTQKDKDVVDTGFMKMSNISTPNSFAALGEDEEEEVENIWDESVNLNIHHTGVSTPANTVPDV
uniref:Uncharacterized protein n=1 Tax=Tanacetum cinerariifolium TaxID=118510 RepID=A0A6L2JMF3_TANCI|nr:hypothetical protein [Tanacetum cinerariifolium]